jgi:hypothetical protein
MNRVYYTETLALRFRDGKLHEVYIRIYTSKKHRHRTVCLHGLHGGRLGLDNMKVYITRRFSQYTKCSARFAFCLSYVHKETLEQYRITVHEVRVN